MNEELRLLEAEDKAASTIDKMKPEQIYAELLARLIQEELEQEQSQ
jgi:hypothetical protein